MNRLRPDQTERARAAWHGFYQTSIASLLEQHLAEVTDARVLEHFQQVAREVPAYAAFLAQHGVAS